MLFVKKYVNKNRKSTAYGKTYGKPVILGTVKTNELTDSIEEKCTVHAADIKAVLIALKKVVAERLQDGYRVHLEGLGFLKLSISTKGETDPEDFVFPGSVTKTRVLFQPEKTLVEGHFVNPLTSGIRFRDAAFLSKPSSAGSASPDPSEGGGSNGGSESGGNDGGGGNDPVEERP